jgi:Phage Terminase
MPWQQLVADVGLEVDDDGIPFYREVVVTIPRQNGKTTLMLAWEIHRAVAWPTQPQVIAYTAQDGKAAREKMLNEQAPKLLDTSNPIHLLVDRILKGIGNESFLFTNGSRVFPLSSSEQSGHGKVVDLAVLDETFVDEDYRREQALRPAMITRRDAQILNISTAGTERSAFLRAKVDAGRAAVVAGKTTGIAYFEWSANGDAPHDDPATWYSCMPALGVTIDEAVIRDELSMPEGEFRRAYLNQWTVSDERVIPANVWEAVCRTDVKPSGRLVFGVEVTEDRTAASIAVADDEGRVEIVDQRPGPTWVVDRVVELANGNDGDVVIDNYGPAANLASDIDLRIEGRVIEYATRDMSQACATFYDAIADGTIAIRSSSTLDRAVVAATKRQTGDTWLWARRNAGADISPLIAATIAFAEAQKPGGNVFFSYG